ncbi:MAG: hypothetical protein WBH86_08110, partial [Thermogutta sp.]
MAGRRAEPLRSVWQIHRDAGLLPPLKVNFWVCRQGYCDLVYPPNNDILVSLRFREIFADEGLRGLSSFDPVELAKVRPRSRAKEPPPAYFRALVCRSQAVV